MESFRAKLIKNSLMMMKALSLKNCHRSRMRMTVNSLKNPVVFRSINETRKLINAIIDKYGYPNAVNIETADEVNKTYEDRQKDTKRNKDNEKDNDRIIKQIIDLTNYSPEKARSYIEKYKLWEAQEGKCLYSGTPIEKSDLLNDTAHLYEVDHIIPYSLILDNTLKQ